MTQSYLIEREAVKAIFSFNTVLDDPGPEEVSGRERARDNTVAFMAEVVQRLKALSGRGSVQGIWAQARDQNGSVSQAVEIVSRDQ